MLTIQKNALNVSLKMYHKTESLKGVPFASQGDWAIHDFFGWGLFLSYSALQKAE
jgi:hypothetical protein